MSCIIKYKGQKYSEEQFKEYFIDNKQEFATSIAKNKYVIEGFKDFVQGKQFQKLTSEEKAKTITVYQGKNNDNDNREFNYYTTNPKEASDYGSIVEKINLNTSEFLVKRNEDNSWSNEFSDLHDDFLKLGNKTFDILDNSKEGLENQSNFFNFLKSRGYKGYAESPAVASGAITYENDYLVSFSDNMFQVESIFNSIDSINKKLTANNRNGHISDKKLIMTLTKSGLSHNLASQFSSLLKDNPSLRDLKLRDVLNTYLKEFIKDSDKQYYKAISEPISKELEETLIKYFDKFHIRKQELDNLKEKFGVDSIGVFDVLAKTIYYAKNRNLLTLPEEYGHVFVELMGSVGNRKANNPNFKYLMDNITSWDGYNRVFKNYKDLYVTAEGNIDIYKIKKEAIGQAIGIALVRNHKVQKGDNDFWKNIQSVIDYVLNLIKGINHVSLNTTVDEIAKGILSNNYSKLDRLQKDTNNYNLLSYSETIQEQNKKDGGKALKFMKWFSDNGMIITGSLAYRLQGTVYRPEIDALHDIDNIVPSDIHGFKLNKSNYLTEEQLELDKLRRKLISEGNYKEAKKIKIPNSITLDVSEVVDKIPVLKQFKELYPDQDFLYSFFNQKANAYYVTINSIWSENKELRNRFKNYNGSFNDRLMNFTKDELSQIYLFDFFLRPESTEEYYKVSDEEYGLSLAHFNYSFYEKLNMMGRPKDAFDYQNWDYFNEVDILPPDFNDRLVYFQKNINLENVTSEPNDSIAINNTPIQSISDQQRESSIPFIISQLESTIENTLSNTVDEFELLDQINTLEEKNKVEKECFTTPRAHNGMLFSNNNTGTWEIYKDLEGVGKTHKQGGIDISVEGGKVLFKSNLSKIHAAHGMVIPSDEVN